MYRAHGNWVTELTVLYVLFSLKSVLSNTKAIFPLGHLELPCLTFLCFVFRFDEAALSIQKEKNIYKEIENYPTCYKVCFESAYFGFIFVNFSYWCNWVPRTGFHGYF